MAAIDARRPEFKVACGLARLALPHAGAIAQRVGQSNVPILWQARSTSKSSWGPEKERWPSGAGIVIMSSNMFPMMERPMAEKEVEQATSELFEAIEQKSAKRALKAVEAGASLSAKKNGLTPLLLSIRETELYSSGSLARMLVKRGAPLTDTDRERKNETALHKAARIRWPELAEALLFAGADPNAQDSTGDTPLIEAAFTHNLDVVEALLADPRTNAKHVNDNGLNALHMCLGQCLSAPEDEARVEVARALMRAGIDVDARDEQGRTALMMAWVPACEAASIADAMLEHGAQMGLMDANGRTAEELARISGRAPELADVLQARREQQALSAISMGKAGGARPARI